MDQGWSDRYGYKAMMLSNSKTDFSRCGMFAHYHVYILAILCLLMGGPHSSCPSFYQWLLLWLECFSPTSPLDDAIHLMPVGDEHSHWNQRPPSTALAWSTLAFFEMWFGASLGGWLWSNNLLADSKRFSECVLVSVLRLELYKMSRWCLLPCLNRWSEPVGTQREICG